MSQISTVAGVARATAANAPYRDDCFDTDASSAPLPDARVVESIADAAMWAHHQIRAVGDSNLLANWQG